MSWAQLIQNSDLQALKTRVPLAAVVEHEGVVLEQSGDRLVGLCPFHDDDRPSFAVWQTDDGSELCGCWSCDFRPADVYTFLQRKRGIRFTDAAALLLQFAEAGLTASQPLPAARASDPTESRRVVAEATDPVPMLEFLESKDLPIEADPWLVSEFRLRGRRDEIIIPHFDRNGEIRATKHRAVHGKPITVAGGQLSALYGEWRDRGNRQVILVEGESDVWLAAWRTRDEDVDVLGLPSGASAKPRREWVEQMAGREVTIMFDADEAGRRAAATWASALLGVADVVRVAVLPEGNDVCDVSEAVFNATRRGALPYRDLAGLVITKNSGRYQKTNAQGLPIDLSDFTFDVEGVVEVPNEASYFIVSRGQDRWYLSTRLLSNVHKFRQWCGDRLLVWRGSQTDAVDLLELLKAEAVCESRFLGAHTTGLHDDSFVLPDETIGSSPWIYMDEGAPVRAADFLNIRRGGYSPLALHHLVSLHSPSVMTPILGWMAAAPLRALCPQFPILAVTGGSGYGKTTLVSAVLEAFGYWTTAAMTLSSTTPHAVQSFVANSNGFPVWFDEYRRGARESAKVALDQIIRDAWDGSSSVKGGYGEDKTAIRYLHATAPLIVTGEDAFTETSHAERMVLIDLPRAGRNPAALEALAEIDTTGLGYAYLEWLAHELTRDEFIAPPHIRDRHLQTQAVVRWGYNLLDEFAGRQLPPLDFSLVEAQFTDVAGRNPYVEAIREALDKVDRGGNLLAWVQGDTLCLRTRAIVSYIRQETDIILPGGSSAMLNWLAGSYEIERNCRGAYGMFQAVHGAVELLAGE